METVADETETGVATSVTNVELGLPPTSCGMGQAGYGIEDSFGGRQRRSPGGETGNGNAERDSVLSERPPAEAADLAGAADWLVMAHKQGAVAPLVLGA